MTIEVDPLADLFGIEVPVHFRDKLKLRDIAISRNSQRWLILTL